MLSVFPEFFNYSFFAPFILRVILGLVFLWFGYSIFRTNTELNLKIMGSAMIIISLFLIAGLFTQIAAMAAIIMILIQAINSKVKNGMIRGKILKILMVAVALSLILLGPGIFAFDLPL